MAPEIVDIEIQCEEQRTPTLRRGLMLVAKIIQNLANNVSFGKEGYLVVLNPFLEENVRKITQYLSEAQV